MIDAHENLAEAVNDIAKASIRQDQTLRYLLDEYTITLAGIARRQNVSRTQLYREPWRVPNFGGNPDASTSPKEWYLSTYMAWIRTPEEERRKQWDSMSVKDKKKVRAA